LDEGRTWDPRGAANFRTERRSPAAAAASKRELRPVPGARAGTWVVFDQAASSPRALAACLRVKHGAHAARSPRRLRHRRARRSPEVVACEGRRLFGAGIDLLLKRRDLLLGQRGGAGGVDDATGAQCSAAPA
jgi:hypothetical protein